MSKANYEAMTREELKEYLRKVDRNNDEAWDVFFDKLESAEGKTSYPYTENPQQIEKNLKEYLERKRNS